ncbi:hypothetical protein O988_04665 [Pseudogymnoascus sp. VKM F-3808]|nr:hypothetical protein O988_04665 [Pseudogymnoascus sp. VKM F-3808]
MSRPVSRPRLQLPRLSTHHTLPLTTPVTRNEPSTTPPQTCSKAGGQTGVALPWAQAMGACFWASERALAGVLYALLSDAADGCVRGWTWCAGAEPYSAPLTATANFFSTTTIKMPQTHTARTSPFPQPSNSTSLARPTPRRSLSLLTDVAQRLDTHTPSTDYKTRDAAGGEWHAPPPPPPSPVSW